MKTLKTLTVLAVFMLSSFLTKAQTDCANFTMVQEDIGEESETFGMSLADFDGDGWKDVVTIDAYNEIEVYFNNGDGSFNTTPTLLGEDSWRFGVEVIDIENDGDWDFVTSPFSTTSGNGMEVWENDGTGNFTLKADGVGGNASGYEFAVGDLNGDGFTDIFFPHSDIDILLNDGNGNFVNNGQSGFSVSSAESVALADFDNDNDLDAVVVRGGGEGFVGKVFTNDGNGQFTNTGQEISYGNAEGVGAADIDADGDIDIVVAPWHGNVILYLNDGLGTFVPGDTLFEATNFYNEIILVDQNFDGLPDIFTDKNIWLNDTENPGSFILQDFTMSASNHDFEVTDINNDNLMDIYLGHFSGSDGDIVYFGDEPTFIDVEETLCYGDSLQIAGVWQTEAGLFYEYNACTELNRVSLDFYDEINTEVTESEGILIATETGAEYQWLDCNDNNNPIFGETYIGFAPGESGDYAVVITQNGICVDTSECYNFIATNITENNPDRIMVYPNPTTGIINLLLFAEPENISMTDITGKTIYDRQPETHNRQIEIDISNQSAGIYFIRIQTEKDLFIKKIYKN